MWTEAQLAYMAGIVDGEGSIVVVPSYSKTKGKRYERYIIRIHAYNTDPTLMVWLKQFFGGSWSPVKRRRIEQKQSYQWYVGHTAAATIAKAILPYLVIKQRQAEILIEFAASMTHKHARGLPNNVIEMRNRLYAECAELNRRGPKDAVDAA